MQPKRFFGRVSHIPSQRSGFVGLLQDLIHISSLQDNYKISEPVLSPSEESHIVDEAKQGNKTAQEKLVDHYDTLAANAYLKAYSVKDEEERRKYLRQWCFYASRAEEIDCPSSAKDVQRLEKQFYIGHPPKEAKRFSSTIMRREHDFQGLLIAIGFGIIIVICAVGVCEVGICNKRTVAFILLGTLLGIVYGIGYVIIGRRIKETIYTCGNCGEKVTSSFNECLICKTKLKG